MIPNVYDLLTTIFETMKKPENRKLMMTDIDNILHDALMSVKIEYPEITLDLMQCRSRERRWVEPRQLMQFIIMKRYTGQISQSQCGYWFGRDHTTVIHSMEAIEDLIATNREFARVAHRILGYYTELRELHEIDTTQCDIPASNPEMISANRPIENYLAAWL